MSAHEQHSFFARLRRRWEQADTMLCVGLDGELERLPAAVRGTAQPATDAATEALVAFHTAIVDATADLVCAFKPNSAFYEAHGPAGMRALQRIIAHIHAHFPAIPVLLDAKRGDVGSTSQAYAHGIFDVYQADGITLHPYLGAEALAPFLERGERGIFILCRTSNPGAGELQDLPILQHGGHEGNGGHGDEARRLTTEGTEGTAEDRALQRSTRERIGEEGTALRVDPSLIEEAEPLYLHVARLVAERWNARGNCGLVAGATYPQELAAIRAVAGDLPILVPGIGAQGGDVTAAVRAGRDRQGRGLLLSASRSVLYASSGADFAEAARREAIALRDAIASVA